jgi:hypothetical protein
MNNFSCKLAYPTREAVSLNNGREVSKVPSRASRLGQTTDPISSLNEAWLHTIDRCAVDTPLSGLILPLMRSCFFGGAMHAVLLLQNGHGDRLATDIAGFVSKEQS